MHTLTDSSFHSVTIQDPEGSAEEILELLKWNFGKKTNEYSLHQNNTNLTFLSKCSSNP